MTARLTDAGRRAEDGGEAVIGEDRSDPAEPGGAGILSGGPPGSPARPVPEEEGAPMRMFTVLGPSQSGKTTLTAALAALDGRPRASREGDPVTLTEFGYLGDDWIAADVAGGVEHLPHAARALAASDACVLVVPPDADAAVLAAPWLRLIDQAGVPAILFVNRMDAAEGRVRDIVAALQGYSRAPIVLRQVPVREGGRVVGVADLISERAFRWREGDRARLIEMPEGVMAREKAARGDLLETLSDFDDHLLEQLVEDVEPPTAEVYGVATRALEAHGTLPAFLGAAARGNGVERLMKSLRHEAPEVAVTARRLGLPADTRVIPVLADVRKHVGRAVAIRALGRGLAAGEAVSGAACGALTGLDGRTPVQGLAPGAVGVAVKSDHLDPCRALDGGAGTLLPDWTSARPPMLARILRPTAERDEARLSAALSRLHGTDPGLETDTDEATGRPLVRVQGPMHLRRLLALLDAEFGVGATAEPVPPAYRETITRMADHHHRHRKQTGGAGQFADVRLTVEPLVRGAGFVFADTVKGGAVPRTHIPAVGDGAEEALAEGPLGFPVVDVAVTLTDGKAHAVDSSDFAFRTAGRAAVKAALADCGPVLLQPMLRATIHAPQVFSGALATLVGQIRGQVEGFEGDPDAPGWEVLRAILPAAAEDDLAQGLSAATQGTGWAETAFDHYREMQGREAEAVARPAEMA